MEADISSRIRRALLAKVTYSDGQFHCDDRVFFRNETKMALGKVQEKCSHRKVKKS